MSRHGYSDECDDNWQMIRWSGALNAALRGARGQAFLRELAAALDAMPEKRLVANEWVKDGEACALGVVARARGLEEAFSGLDPDDEEAAGHAARLLNIAGALAREVVWWNDEGRLYFGLEETPEERWTRMRRWVTQKIAEGEQWAAKRKAKLEVKP